MKFQLPLICLLLCAADVQAATVADLHSSIIEENYKKASEVAKMLQVSNISNDQGLEVRYYLGLSYLRLGDYSQAQDTFRRLLKERLTADLYDKASVGHIDSLYMQGFYENALKEASRLISHRPESDMLSLFYLKAARANLKLARWSKAQEWLKKIVEAFPESFESKVARQLLEEKQFFTVQVGSYADKAMAQQLVTEIAQRKEYVYMVEAKGADGRPMFRVRVGQMSSLNDARKLEVKLSGLGYPTLIYP